MQMSFWALSIPLDYVSWDTSENICSFTLIRIVFRYNNLPLRIALTSPSAIPFLFFFFSFPWTFNGMEFRWFPLFCFVYDEKVVSIWCCFFWIVPNAQRNKCKRIQCPWLYLAFTKYSIKCTVLSIYALLVAPKRIQYTHTQSGTKKTLPFQCFFFKAYTKFPFTTVVQK